MRKVTYLDQMGQTARSGEFEETARGVIIPVGADSEILIPWGRVLEVWDKRGGLCRDNGKETTGE